MPNNYLPIPPRAWSRVQNKCTYTVPGSTYGQAYIPLTKQTVSQAQANYEEQLLNKGNILQYKGNSAQLTKSQKYSQLAKGSGPNRTKVFATQGIAYTNPNTTGLQRVGSVNIPFPNQIVGQPNNISGPFQYDVPNPFDCSGNSLQDGGNLVCGTYTNPCTGEIVKQTTSSGPLCFPSYCSDVPGTPIELCWNPKVQTWFPRQRYTMNNSTSKWPQGYKGLVSAETPFSPILTLESYTETTVTLSWTTKNNSCLPITSFRIYQNGVLISTVPYSIMSITISNLINCTLYTFYVTAVSNTIESAPSNSVIFDFPPPPTNLTVTATTYSNQSIILNWTNTCPDVTSWNVYQDSMYFSTVYSNSITISGLTTCTLYTYFVTAVIDIFESLPSNTVDVEIPPAPTNLTVTATTYLNQSITLNWTNTCPDVTNFKIYQNNIVIDTVNTTSKIISGLSTCNLYTYFVTAVITTISNSFESLPSNTVDVEIPPAPTNLTVAQVSNTTAVTLNWNPSTCSDVTSWNVYQNSTYFSTVSTNSATISGLSTCNLYTYFVTAVILISPNSFESLQSTNTVTAEIPPAPTITAGTNSAPGQITLTWTDSGCSDITSYDIYQDGVFYINVFYPATSLNITGFTLPSSYSYSFGIIAKILEGGNVFISPTSTVTVGLPLIYSDTGITTYQNNGYTGLVADTVGSATIAFNYNFSINVLVVAGGGGGGTANPINNIPGGGGGGAGIFAINNFPAQPIQYYLTIGGGGAGAPLGSFDGTDGDPSYVKDYDNITILIATTGGGGADGANGGTGGSGYDIYGTFYPLNGGYGGNGQFAPLNGQDSTVPIYFGSSYSIPFTSPAYTLYLSGGGGGANILFPFYGGTSGNGIGGVYGANLTNNGENASTSFSNPGYFGGGGGGGYSTTYTGGDGADGVIIFWWLDP
jgi:hypothetical protein